MEGESEEEGEEGSDELEVDDDLSDLSDEDLGLEEEGSGDEAMISEEEDSDEDVH